MKKFPETFMYGCRFLVLYVKVSDITGKACLYGHFTCDWPRTLSINQTMSVLDGELAVPCNPESAIPGLNSHPRA